MVEQEVDFVAGDELNVLSDAQIGVRLVVEQVERELVFMPTDSNAARFVDRVDGHIIGVAVVAPRIRQGTRKLYGT